MRILDILEKLLALTNSSTCSATNWSINLKSGTDVLPSSLMSTYPALLGENDVVQFIKMLPGVQTTTEGLNGLYIRGGLPQHTSFLIDDAPMFNMYHYSGWFSTVNPDAVKEVKLYKSHLPAKTGGSLGSIVDIRLRDGNNQHFNCTGGIGTITSRLTLEGPIIRNKSSFIISARRSYLDQVVKLFKIPDAEDMEAFYFYDLNAKVNYTLNHQNRLYLSAYAGQDVFKDTGGTSWGNSLLSARWNHLFSESTFANLTLTGSWYNHKFDGYSNETDHFKLAILLRNYHLKYDLTHYTRLNNKINLGLSARVNQLPPTLIRGNGIFIDKKEEDRKSYGQLLTALFLQEEFDLTRQWSADAGIRIIMADKLYPNDLKTRINFEPILSLRYALTGESVFKTAYSRNYQYYHGANVFELIIPFDRYILASNKLKPQYADHLSAGFFYTSDKRWFEFSVESFASFYRNQYRIPVSNDVFFNRDAEVSPIKGKLNTYGVEVSLRRLTGRFTGMISYTLAKVSKQEEGINNGNWYQPCYDRRHDLVCNINYRITPKILVSANWVYMSGNPFSLPVGKYELRGRSIPLYDKNSLYNSRMPDYHRLDFSARFGFGKKNPSRHSLSIIVYNLYARKNPVFYSYRDVADGDLSRNPDTGYAIRNFSMTEYYFFNIFPSFSYEFKFGK
jgi:outer membrane receptor for ferrienterochelin and colicin